ncbi:MAG: TrkH family potassium uptake protein [Acidimicrobiales bacterium]
MSRRSGDVVVGLVAENRRIVAPTAHVVGLALLFLVPGLAVSALIEWGSSASRDADALVVTMIVSGTVGLALWRTTRIPRDMGRRSIFSIVAWTWLACSVVGALPYVLSDTMFTWHQWDGALFESISGFSCTGSTVLADIDAHGRGILMWRQLTQWYGGMGMVVLAVTVLPFLGVGGLELMGAEAPGPSSDRLAPRVSETAKRLWVLYAGLTVAIALALFAVPGVGVYDAFAHALTTSATGGFSPYGASVGHLDSLAAELVIAAGLLVCAMNFTAHYRALTGDPRVYLRMSDQILYLKIVAGATAVVTVLLWVEAEVAFATALRDGLFNVVSLASSGGFGNIRADGGFGDFVLWPAAAQIVLLGLMLVGGSIGSTAGGLKVYRVQVASRQIARSLRSLSHPRAVLPVKLGSTAIPEPVVRRALGFTTAFVLIAGVGIMVVTALGADLVTATGGVLSAMSNMGPALGEAGPDSTFLAFTRPARLVLAALMLVGRLEIFAVVLMFASGFQWLARHAPRSRVSP